LALIDFFPGVAKQQTETALEALETAISRALSPDEPHIQDHPVTLLDHSHYQGRRWATRRRPWVDRLACAWLIQRFIDSGAKSSGWNPRATAPPMHWALTSMAPRSAMSGTAVTFETLIDSFVLQAPGLSRIAALVHYLDVGGSQPAEASGIERVLAGLREHYR
jgi:hypothetical protein